MTREVESEGGERRPEAGRLCQSWLLIILLLALVPISSIRGATYTWTGAGFNGDTDYRWSNPLNWQGLAAPQSGETGVALVFPNSNAPRNTTNDVLNLGISSIIFFGSNYGIHGGSNGITMTLAGTNGSSFAVVGAANNCQFGPGTRLHLGTTGSVAVASGSTLIIKSRLSGVPGFTKLSPGTLSLQATQANTFFGTVTVLNGLLELRNQGISIPGPLVIGDGDMSASPIVRLNAYDQIGDASPVTVNANGKLWLNGNDDAIGSLTLGSGAVSTGIGGGNTLPGLLTLNGNVTNLLAVPDDAGSIAGRLSLGAATRTFNVFDGSELVVSGNISGTAGIMKLGPGQLTMTGTGSDYTGFTTVQTGTLRLAGAANPGATNSGTIVTFGARLILDDATIGREALTLNGSTNLAVLQFAGTNSWEGAVTVQGDCLLDPLRYEIISDDDLTFSGNIGGTGSLRLVDNGTVHFAGLGNNTYTGGYYGERGATYFEKTASALALSGPLFVGRAEDDFPNAFVTVRTLNQIPNTALVTLRNSGALRTENNATDTLGDVVFEGGWLDAGNGVFTLSGNVTNKVSTNNISAIYGNITLPAGEHIFHCEWLGRLDVFGVLQGSGGVTLQGGMGMLSFLNTNTYSGPTHVADGTLRLEGMGRPGSSAAGTRVDGLASLQLKHASVTNESLSLEFFSVYSPIVEIISDNVWKGPVVLNAWGDFRASEVDSLVIDGVISGSEGLWLNSYFPSTDGGTLTLRGTQGNTFAKSTYLKAGTLVLDKTFGVAIPGNLTVGRDIIDARPALVKCLAPHQFAINVNSTPACDVTVNHTAAFDLAGHDQEVRNLTLYEADVDTGGAVLTLGGDLTVAGNGLATSHVSGNVKLVTGAQFGQPGAHSIHVSSNALFFLPANLSEGSDSQSITRDGTGLMLLSGNNTFSGALTLAEGYTSAGGAAVFGTPTAGTVVQLGATLQIENTACTEPFTLAGPGFNGTNAVLTALGTNVLRGPVTLLADALIDARPTANWESLLLLTGPVSGAGGITKSGAGRLRFAGSADNTFSGFTRVVAGVLELAQTNANAVVGPLEIGDGALVRYLRPHQLGDLSPVAVSAGGQYRMLGQDDTIGSLSGSGIVELLAGTLTTGNDGASTTYGGVISGIGGGVTKIGSGAFTLTGSNAYTGFTTIKSGTLIVRGYQPLSDVSIQTGGALAGDGTVGAVNDLSGHVKPGGNIHGVLHCGSLTTFSPGNRFEFKIDGISPGVDCDQLQTTGNVLIMGGALQLAMNFAGAVSNEYVLVKNGSSNPVTGSFVGLPQDALMTNNGVVLQITYHGGDGNDIALIQRSAAGVGPELGSVQKLGNGSIQIGGTGIPNATYNVEATESLTPPVHWNVVGNATANGAGQFTFVDPDAPNFPVRFYRFALP